MFSLIIATCGSFHDYEFLSATVDEWIALHSLDSGDSGIQVLICSKTDPNGFILRYASSRGYTLIFTVDIGQLLKVADGCIVFWDGKDVVLDQLIKGADAKNITLAVVFS